MAVKKAAGGTKKRDRGAAKKAGAKKSVAKKSVAKKAATKKTTTKKGAAKKTTTKKGAAKKTTTKKAVKKASGASTKLSATQSDLLKRIGTAGEAGYRSEKKAEQRTLDSLREKRLVKRGPKDKASGYYHYMISNTGKKHLSSAPASPAASSASSGGSTGGSASTSSPLGGGF